VYATTIRLCVWLFFWLLGLFVILRFIVVILLSTVFNGCALSPVLINQWMTDSLSSVNQSINNWLIDWLIDWSIDWLIELFFFWDDKKVPIRRTSAYRHINHYYYQLRLIIRWSNEFFFPPAVVTVTVKCCKRNRTLGFVSSSVDNTLHGMTKNLKRQGLGLICGDGRICFVLTFSDVITEMVLNFIQGHRQCR